MSSDREAARDPQGTTASTAADGADALAGELAATARSVPGVARIEAPLGRALIRLGRTPSGRTSAGGDVVVSITGSGASAVVDVSIDVVLDARAQALTVGREVRRRLAAVIVAHDRRVGRIAVAVLAVDAG